MSSAVPSGEALMPRIVRAEGEQRLRPSVGRAFQPAHYSIVSFHIVTEEVLSAPGDETNEIPAALRPVLANVSLHPILQQCGYLGIVLLQHHHMTIPADPMLFKAHEVIGDAGLLQVA